MNGKHDWSSETKASQGRVPEYQSGIIDKGLNEPRFRDGGCALNCHTPSVSSFQPCDNISNRGIAILTTRAGPGTTQKGSEGNIRGDEKKKNMS